jgi:hypothetical protein
MSALKFALCALLLLVLGVAADNPRCDTIPAQFTSAISEVLLDPTNCVTGRMFGEIFIDYNAMKTRIDFTYFANDQATNLTIWYDYAAKTETLLNRDANVCQVVPSDLPQSGQKIPSDAAFLGSVFLGSQEIDSYFLAEFPGAPGVSMEFGVTSQTCFVTSAVVNYLNSTIIQPPVFAVQSYWNFVSMVPQYIFDVPSVCNSNSNLLELHSVSHVARTLHRRLPHHFF